MRWWCGPTGTYVPVLVLCTAWYFLCWAWIVPSHHWWHVAIYILLLPSAVWMHVETRPSDDGAKGRRLEEDVDDWAFRSWLFVEYAFYFV